MPGCSLHQAKDGKSMIFIDNKVEYGLYHGIYIYGE